MVKTEEPKQPKTRRALRMPDRKAMQSEASIATKKGRDGSAVSDHDVTDSAESGGDEEPDHEEANNAGSFPSPTSSASLSRAWESPRGSRMGSRLGSDSISPELLLELRKIIREESRSVIKEEVVEQLRRDSLDDKEANTARSREARPAPTHGPASESSPATRHSSLAAGQADLLPPGLAARLGSSSQSPPLSQASLSPKASPSVRFSTPVSPATGASRKDRAAADPAAALDHGWGVLFDADGQPTPRLGQVLRGLANYIIDEFLPQRSLVVTPGKLAAFYSQHRLDAGGEVYPFAALFARSASASRPPDFDDRLADLYQDLDCPYHLVQAEGRGDAAPRGARPRVPGLTPAGFARWVTACLRAYPDEEARRLEGVVAALPFTADAGGAAGRPARLPTRLPRRLLPARPSRKVRQVLDEAIRDFMEETATPPPAAPPPPPPEADPRRSSPAFFRQTAGGASGAPTPTADRRASDVSPRSRYAPLPSGESAPPAPSEGGAAPRPPPPRPSRAASSRDHAPRTMPPPPIGRHHSALAHREAAAAGGALAAYGAPPSPPPAGPGAFELSGRDAGRERGDGGGGRRYSAGGRAGAGEGAPRTSEVLVPASLRGRVDRRSVVAVDDRRQSWDDPSRR